MEILLRQYAPDEVISVIIELNRFVMLTSTSVQRTESCIYNNIQANVITNIQPLATQNGDTPTLDVRQNVDQIFKFSARMSLTVSRVVRNFKNLKSALNCP